MPLRSVMQLLIFYTLALLAVAAITTSSAVENGVRYSTYVFLLKATMLWAGLLWIAVSVYVSLIARTNDFVQEVWIAFCIGSLMAYVGVKGVHTSPAYWIAVQTMLYFLISMAAVSLFCSILRIGNLEPPQIQLRRTFARGRFRYYLKGLVRRIKRRL